MDAPLRIGLAGAGPWARNVHAPGVAAHPGTVLAGVWARRPEAARELADATGAPVAGGFDELLSTVDAVAFAVPPSVQAELAAQAARAGRHLILEKPLTSTVDEAVRLADAVGEAGVCSMMMLTMRFGAATTDWLADIHSGQNWFGGNVRWLSGSLLGGKYAGSRWRHDGGALADVGPHAFDLLDAALGEVDRVHSVLYTEPDLWQVTFHHRTGAASTATMSMHLPIDPSVVDISVYGEPGYRLLDQRPDPSTSYAALLDRFTEIVHSGQQRHDLDVWRGLHLQRLLDQVRRAATR